VNSSRSFVSHPHGLYVAWLALCCLAFWKPLLSVTRYAANNDNASHMLMIPFLVVWLIYLEKRKIASGSLDIAAAVWFAFPAVALSAMVIRSSFADATVSMAISMLALVLFIVAGFVAVFGRVSAKSLGFSLAFLLFLVPLPQPLLARIIYLLQAGSAAVAELIFDWTGTPILRDGFVFHLPKINIEVAQECSGIRSSMALLILALLVAHFAFSTFWKKALFVSAGLLMMVVKNGVRIATLTILANYVNPEFLYGRLHRDGGVVFFLIGLALLWPIYWWLRRGEQVASPSPPASTLA